MHAERVKFLLVVRKTIENDYKDHVNMATALANIGNHVEGAAAPTARGGGVLSADSSMGVVAGGPGESGTITLQDPGQPSDISGLSHENQCLKRDLASANERIEFLENTLVSLSSFATRATTSSGVMSCP